MKRPLNIIFMFMLLMHAYLNCGMIGVGALRETLLVEAPYCIPNTFYGLPVDGFQVDRGKVKRRETLSDILSDFEMDHASFFRMTMATRDKYDTRTLMAGTEYYTLTRVGNPKKPEYVILLPDERSYVVYHLGDAMDVEVVEFPVTLRGRRLRAEVKGSVFETVNEAGAPWELVSRLESIFAWQVDFFHIQQGDVLEVLYTEEVVNGIPAGIKEVTGAYFLHRNKPYYAIYHEPTQDYYDEHAITLQKFFLKAPLRYSRISSHYSKRRFHPVLKRYKAHLGTDYAAPSGTPIMAVGEGVVTQATRGRYNGRYVKISHNETYSSQYLHLSRIARGVRRGKKVKQGQVIGYVGSTGLATGPHLCFRLWKDGNQVDPRKVKISSPIPIQPEHKGQFGSARDRVLSALEELRLEARIMEFPLHDPNLKFPDTDIPTEKEHPASNL